MVLIFYQPVRIVQSVYSKNKLMETINYKREASKLKELFIP